MLAVWWVYNGVFADVARPVEDGTRVDDTVFLDMSHAKLWKTLKLVYPKSIQDLSWSSVPRGRVIFDKVQQRYKVLGPKELLSVQAFRDTLVARYCLPKDSIFSDDAYDDHYADADASLLLAEIDHYKAKSNDT